MRTTQVKEGNSALFDKIAQWANQFAEYIYLDGCDYLQEYSQFDALIAVEAFTVLKTDAQHAFQQLHDYQSRSADWLFGYLSYDLKNDVFDTHSNNDDGLQFPDLFFFQPQKIFILKNNQITMHYLTNCADEMENDWYQIHNEEVVKSSKNTSSITIKEKISEQHYYEKCQDFLNHIQRGDIYEANFCMEFFAENVVIQPFEVYQSLKKISKAPFSTFFKWDKNYLMSASPERFLQKKNDQLISQPIKGTAKRGDNANEDEIIKNNLVQNEKERAENIMIVDLVRNDLSIIAQKNTVQVPHLCQIQSFRQVHQMVSTVSCQLAAGISPVMAIKAAFPMGSMTGAPKLSALNCIEKIEETKRGLYSGAVGYFTPNNDFDFNVVIRSIAYNARNQYLSFSVGSAITAQADIRQEYQECLLKAKAMRKVLEEE